MALAVWQFLAWIVRSEILLVSPVKVAVRLTELVREPDFLKTCLFSLLRITAGWLASLIFGFAVGVLAGRFRWIETLLWPYVSTIKAVPVASFIILCLIWLDFHTLTILIAFLIAFPVIYSNVLAGFRASDPQMTEMARSFRVPWGRRFLYIELPSIRPYLLSAAETTVGMSWKAGVAAEVIGVVSGSIGGKLYHAKIYFESADLFAWTLLIVLLSVLLERAVRLLLRWGFRGVQKL